MKKIIAYYSLVLCLSIFSHNVLGNNNKNDKIDYLSFKFKYVNETYQIDISHDLFQSFIKEYKFYPSKIKTYKDSLSVVFMGEFHDWEKTRIAQNRIGFSWLRAGYYLWLSKNEAKLLGEKYGFKHPYYLYQYFWTDDESKWDEDMKHFMFELRKKVDKVDPNTDVMILKNNKFLMKALLLSPDRIRDYQKLTGQSNSGEGCEKTDCCQTKDNSSPKSKIICDSLLARRYKHFLDVNIEESLKSQSLTVKEKKAKTEMVYTAYKRFLEKVNVKYGLYQIDFTASDINISPDLFAIFKNIFTKANKEILILRKDNPSLSAGDNPEPKKSKHWTWDDVVKLKEYMNN